MSCLHGEESNPSTSLDKKLIEKEEMGLSQTLSDNEIGKEIAKNEILFEIVENDKLGRHLVATKDIPEGTVLIKESALITGPSQMTGPVCLGCYQGLDERNSVECELCGWPMCKSEECKNSEKHKPECDWTANKRQQRISIKQFVSPHRSYECISTIRCLYLKENNAQLWQKLTSLESNCEQRKNTPKYESDKIYIAQFLHRFFKLDPSEFSEEEILKICGILQINGHEVPLSDPPHVGIYSVASLPEHNCLPNCCKSFTDDGDVLIVSARKIKTGEHISICYTDALWGTLNRRQHLADTKHFNCECTRCVDPTELGTYYSAMHCFNKECNGNVVPHINGPIWKCGSCGLTPSTKEISDILQNVGHDYAMTKKHEVDSCKLFLNHYAGNGLLHHNHYILTDVRLKLAQLIGQTEDHFIRGVSDENLQLKYELCQRILTTANVLFPAEWRIRGVMLFELHATIAEQCRRKISSGEVTQSQANQKLLESKDCLEKAARLLQFEPSILPEGKMAAQAKENLCDLDKLLQKIHIED